VTALVDEALHLLSTADARWRTLRASGREWRDTALSADAWRARLERKRAEGQHFSVITLRSTMQHPDELDEEWRLWIAQPWRRANFAAGRAQVDVVFHESTWWSNGHGRSITNGGALNYGHGVGPGEFLVTTAAYPPLIEIEVVATGSRIGRATLEATVSMRHGLARRRGRGLHGLVIGDAEEILLSIDRERGVILRAAGWYRGSVYRIVEMQDVGFDEDFPPTTFEISPLPGLEWLDTRP
jgi:hypothetical protein